MLGLKSKNASEEKVHGARALTPSQWREYLAKQPGEFVVIGGVEGDEFPSLHYSRATAQWIFDELVADNLATDGYRVRIVAVER